jgi:3-deoxy-D-manno-octulosonate 8-phosphate phosphatase KdsC-like HAD superfamily phosphatase
MLRHLRVTRPQKTAVGLTPFIVNDLPAIKITGLRACPSDAIDDVREIVNTVLIKPAVVVLLENGVKWL